MKRTIIALTLVLLAGCSALQIPPEIDPGEILRLVAELAGELTCRDEPVPDCAARAADDLVRRVPEIPDEIRDWLVGLIRVALEERLGVASVAGGFGVDPGSLPPRWRRRIAAFCAEPRDTLWFPNAPDALWLAACRSEEP